VVAPLSVAAAATVLGGIYAWLDHGLVPTTPAGTGSEADRTLDIAKVAIALAGVIGAVLTGVYAYRKQRLAEGDARRADAEQLATRFGRASEQLGHDSAAVRLAGMYAMAALADDWTAQRQLCVNVLTTYLQVPYEPDLEKPGHRHGEREVRRNVLRVIRDHLREGFSDVSWCGYNFRFEDAVFDGGDLTGARFTGGNVTFHSARFVGGTFHFDNVRIEGAQVWFTHTRFEGGEVRFEGAALTDGALTFDGAQVTGGAVTFDGFRFEGGELEEGPFAGQISRPAMNP
jgi:uncharacterized protein YjbI with pentapeptide repeats